MVMVVVVFSAYIYQALVEIPWIKLRDREKSAAHTA